MRLELGRFALVLFDRGIAVWWGAFLVLAVDVDSHWLQ